jgi:bacterioferritin-associated ferredoxin
MYVCSCNRLTDTQVAEAICLGAGSPDEVYAACGCQKQCGRCASTMSRYLRAPARVGENFSADFAPAAA